MPELRRFFFWWFARWFAGDVLGSGLGSSACSGGVDGGSEGSDVGAGEAGAWETLDARRVTSEDAEELVASRRYSTTSQVCRVASGAKETRRAAACCQYSPNSMAHARDVPSDLRRASLRFFSSSSLDDRIDLTAGMKADLRLFPLLCFSAGGSLSARPPGPMLLLRVFREDLRGDSAGASKDVVALKEVLATRPSAMFSLPSALVSAMVCAKSRRDVMVVLLGIEASKQEGPSR